MRLGIHPRKGSYSERWIEYCETKGIDYKIVNCYKPDIIEQLSDCDALLWHYYHECVKDIQVAKQLLFALEGSGKVVFPDFVTNWHFDDKVGQKYLFESFDAPLVPSYAFYDKKQALQWAGTTSYPKVFKLRGGAASDNVKLVRTQSQAIRLIKKAFGRGFLRYNPWVSLKERWRLFRLGRTDIMDCVKGLVRFFIPTYYCRVFGRDKGYVYFQDFIPNNQYDIRVLYVFNRCLAFRRVVRPGDFRASGSRVFDYEQSHVPKKALQVTFEVAEKLGIQAAAFDFVMKEDEPQIVELSYASGPSPEQNDHGYYEKDLSHHPEAFNPYDWVIEGVIDKIKEKTA
jgi:glutathione synthase/RimK-type ligase-like ATP-grasp enzyme